MFAGTWDRSMKIWNPGSSLTGVDFSGHARPITAVAWLSTGDLVTASRDQILLLWDSESGERLGAMVGHTNAVHCVAETAAGVVVSGGRDKSLRLWDTSRLECVLVIAEQGAPGAEAHIHRVR